MGMRRRVSSMPRQAMFAISASWAWSGSFAAPPALPVPCAAGACGAKGPAQLVTSGTATAVATQNALTVNQSTNSAILNWSSFNIGAGGTVTFKQPSMSAIALNRIFQGSPSQIFGGLNANGQVYLINQNGFLFGSTSTVNVGSLLVSSLPLTLSDTDFSKGILSPIQSSQAVFAAGDPLLDANGKPIPVQVVVQQGAQITAADQGRILLAGQAVTNGGTLTAPDGQVILAAGQKVYLQASTDPSIRGLVVEVDQGGTAWNQLTGSISTPRGNVTMVGLAVNQDGRVSATTSVASNGSIHLEAADGFSSNGPSKPITSSHGGTLTIGPQSQTEILPELSSSDTAVAAQIQYPSSVTLLGEQVILQGGSIVAPGGNLTAVAAANPSGGVVGADPNARLRIDPGTTIDLSGSTASLPMSANLVSAQLRSSELADDPTQRNGALHGLTVYVDARNQPPQSLANVSGEVASVPQTIAQRTENGGHAVLESEGDVVFAKGASLNVSGGSTTYAGGVMQTSYLVGANGQLYPIATANPLLTYVGVLNPTFSQTYNSWGVKDVLPTPGLSAYQPGYVQGAPAGSVQIAAPNMVLQGSLLGSAINGMYQRSPSTAVLGGQLIIGIPGGVGNSGTTPPLDYFAPAVQLTTTPTPIIVADDASLPGQLTLDLPVSYLTTSGFTSTKIYSNYGVILPAGTPLTLPPGSTFTVDAARVDVLSSITDAGGTLSFQNVDNKGSEGGITQTPGVYIGDGVTLDVRGLWTNDLLTSGTTPALSATWQNGGSINLGTEILNGALLSLGNDVTLRTSGGAWLDATGNTVAGTGGSLTLNAAATGGGLLVGSNLAIDGFGVNGAQGGTFSLGVPRIEIGSTGTGWITAQQTNVANTSGSVVGIRPSLFSDFGFQNFNINALGLVVTGAPTTNTLTLDAGTTLAATVSSLTLGSRTALLPSAATLDGVATVTTLPPYLRPSASLNFSSLPPIGVQNTSLNGGTSAGDIMIGTGASIGTDAGGSISLTSLGSIIVDGELRAPGGSVALNIISPAANIGGVSGAYGSFDVGFLPTQRLELGAASIIDVSGTSVSQPSVTGLNVSKILGGGTVNLFADRGVVLADAGSQIAASGTAAPLDVLQPNGSYVHELVSTAGGSITVHSGESISLLGSIEAAAGPAGTTGPAAGGSLEVDLTRGESWWTVTNPSVNSTFNQGQLTVDLLPAIAPGAAPSVANSNQAALGVSQIYQSGVDALRIEAGDVLQVSGDLSLALGRQLVISAPVIAATGGAHASFSAPYLEVGFGLQTPNLNPALRGNASLSFSGNEIDLVGTSVFQGTSAVSFVSSGDLLLRGGLTGSGLQSLLGSLTLDGKLTLDAARIYPVTATSFAITAAADPVQGIPGTVIIGQTGANPGTPLSAGGALTINADTVTSIGTLYAPFGTISLNANLGLTLGDGSLTSVSGAGSTIPYGGTQYGGQQWLYTPGAASPQTVPGVPTRAVNLTAPSVTLTKQATIDLSGGGDLSAYEWVPGTGGTHDVLAPGFAPGLYAILPSTRGQASPQDPQYSSNGNTIPPAGSVYLSAAPGLAAGFYPLLPARYALLPGAFLIQTESQYSSTGPGTLGALADGTPVVAGYLSYGSSGLHQTPGFTGFAVYPGTYGNQLASYQTSLASTFTFLPSAAAGTASVPPRQVLPADAGSLAISVTNSSNVRSALDIAAGAEVRTAAASGGLGAPISISATDLVVGTASGPVAKDAVSVSSVVLESWQPGSLLLGGAWGAADGSKIDVLANSVTVGAGPALAADSIVVVAAQAIDVQAGASLESTSATSSSALAKLPTQLSVELSGPGGGNAGFLAVSDRNWLIPSRLGSAGPAGAGTVTVESGAAIASRGSLSIDAPGSVTLNDGTLTGVGAEWSLGSSSIAIGSAPSAAGTHSDTLTLGSGMLGQLDAAGAVRLASTSAIDLMSAMTLGNADATGAPTLQSLTLIASSLNNLTSTTGGPGTATEQFAAQKILLQGAAASGPAGVAGTGGALNLVAGELDLGPNALAVNGFATTTASVSGAVIGQGVGSLSVGGDLAFKAAGVTAATAANTTISATGALSVAPTAAAHAGTVPSLPGGALALSGTSVDISGNVTASAGIVSITAGRDVSVDPGATISTAGTVVSIGNQSVGTPGGSIAISAGGNLVLGPTATIDVSGAGSAAAGSLTLNAVGAAQIDATLNGSGGPGAAGGSFALDAGSLSTAGGTGGNPLTPIAAALLGGGFNQAIDVRVRTGDLGLDAGSTLKANSVTLSADTGNVRIGGDISADSGALRGTISLFGGVSVELASGGALHSDGAGASGQGGTIEIGVGRLLADANGVLDTYGTVSARPGQCATISICLDAGSTISTAGAAGRGTLLLRAPAITASNDIAIQTLASNTSAVGQIIIEPVLPLNTNDQSGSTVVFSSATTPSAGDWQNVQAYVSNYMANAATNISTRLASTLTTPLSVNAGVEVIAPGALVLQSADGSSPALDLSSWRSNTGAPIDLTLRAVGDITVNNTVTDGFTDARLHGVTQPTLLPGASASIRLAAGADLSSADPLAVNTLGAGTLTFGPNAVVRTGTGNIDLAAAGNILLAGAGSGAYTAGVPAVAPGGTAANPYALVPTALGKALPEGVLIPGSDLLMSFPTGGGDLRVSAGGSIENLSQTAAGSVSTWQLREGGASYKQPGKSLQTAPAMWGVNLAAYNWNFGTLGGGDLRIAAGADAINVSAAAANSLLPQQGGALQYVKGGGLDFKTGGNIGSAQVFVADGTGSVAAGGALTAVLPSIQPNEPTVGSAFYLQSSSINVNARLGMSVDGIFNPTGLQQPGDPSSGSLPPVLGGYFLSYGDTSALRLESTAGDVSLGAAPTALNTLLGITIGNASGNGQTSDVLPPTLSIAAVAGNIAFGAGLGRSGDATLAPSPQGQLDLLAAKDITNSTNQAKLTMSDAPAGSYNSVALPGITTTSVVENAAFVGDIHAADATPALVTAGGDITQLSLRLPKAAQIVAGGDIVDLTFQGQNLNSTDVTSISAGRDITYSPAYGGGSAISVGGPGAVDLLAGRNISLGTSQGVVTTGNLLNPNLPTSQGADLTLVTGLGMSPDFATFLQDIIVPSPTYQAELVSYVETLKGSTGLSFAAAETVFQGLTQDQQRPLIDSVFFNELLLSGRAASGSTTPVEALARGYAAIDDLYPGSRSAAPGAIAGAYAGNLTLDFSRIYTLSGGNINLVVPGGGIDVGLANPPSLLGNRAASTLGIVAQGAGNVDIYAKSSVNVNASRIFTLGGGNIEIWSNEGSIDAGRGSKTAVSAPPPTVLINSDGSVTLDFSGAASGSGIATIQTNPSFALGNVDLFAPVGTIDAGDAGIRAAGNLHAVGTFIGVGNVTVGGTATGVPPVVGDLGAALSGASGAATGASNTATSALANNAAAKEGAAPLAQTALSWLDVFVTGLGEENCKSDDIECLKRQKTPTR
jgi:filamentous hemagglutinin